MTRTSRLADIQLKMGCISYIHGSHAGLKVSLGCTVKVYMYLLGCKKGVELYLSIQEKSVYFVFKCIQEIVPKERKKVFGRV